MQFITFDILFSIGGLVILPIFSTQSFTFSDNDEINCSDFYSTMSCQDMLTIHVFFWGYPY